MGGGSANGRERDISTLIGWRPECERRRARNPTAPKCIYKARVTDILVWSESCNETNLSRDDAGIWQVLVKWLSCDPAIGGRG